MTLLAAFTEVFHYHMERDETPRSSERSRLSMYKSQSMSLASLESGAAVLPTTSDLTKAIAIILQSQVQEVNLKLIFIQLIMI